MNDRERQDLNRRGRLKRRSGFYAPVFELSSRLLQFAQRAEKYSRAATSENASYGLNDLRPNAWQRLRPWAAGEKVIRRRGGWRAAEA